MEQVRRYISKTGYPAAVVFCFALLFLCIPITYGINDDMTMRDIASGVVSGMPDGHLVYIQYALGRPLSFLFQAWKGIDWYALFFLTVMLLCFGLTAYRLCALWKEKGAGKWLCLFFSAAFFILVYLRYFVSFQYTITASVTGGTAAFFYFTLDPEKRTGRRLGEYAIVLALLWLTYCIRPQVFWMAAPFGGILFLYKKGVRTAEKGLLFFLALLGLLGIFLMEQNAYSSQEWKDFRKFNLARQDIFDYYGVPGYEENRDFYRSVGMEECDVVNLERYNLYLIDGIEDGKLEKTAAYAKRLWEEAQTWEQKLKAGVRLAVKAFASPESLLLNAAGKLLLLLGILRAFRRREGLGLLAALTVVEVLLWLYLGYRGRLPDRVGSSLLMLSFSCVLANCCDSARKEGRRSFFVPGPAAAAVGILILALCGGCLVTVRREQMEEVRRNQEFEVFQDWFAKRSENVYFYPTAFLGGYTENVRLFRAFKPANSFLLGGWLSFSPVELEGMERFGIIEVDKALIEKDNIYLVMTNASSRVDEHYRQKQLEITWEEADRVPAFQTEVPVWKLQAEGEGA